MKRKWRVLLSLLLLAAPTAVQAQFGYKTNSGAITLWTYYGTGGAVVISNFVNIIGGAFAGCTSLTSVTIPSSVTNIGDGAFGDCTNLRNATIPNGVTSIGISAFYDCYNLAELTIPNSVTSIGVYSFWGCSNLTSITIPNSLTNIDEMVFRYCTGLTNLTIPGNVANIGDEAFYGCINLTSINFQGNAPTIAPSAFLYEFGYDPNATVYYLPGTSGWSSPFAGLPSVMLNPPIPAGSLQVTITPSSVITGGAQWQVDFGTAQDSGATVLGLSAGNHTVSFSTVSGWIMPFSQTVLVSANSTTTTNGTYMPPNGSLAGNSFGNAVTGGIYPYASSGYFLLLPASTGSTYQAIGIYNSVNSSGTYSNGADGTLYLNDSVAGSFIVNLNYSNAFTGSYFVTNTAFKAYQEGDFEKFSGQVPTSVAGKLVECTVLTGLYPFANAGTFTLQIANSANTYTVIGDGTNTVDSSGNYSYSEINGTTGAMQISDSLSGSSTVYLAFSNSNEGGFALKSLSTEGFQIGHFVTTDTGSLQVSISPTAAVSAGASWRVDGGPFQTSGTTVGGLIVGSHILSFNTISGWLTPSNETVEISSNSTGETNGNYIATGALTVMITPATAITAGAKWQLDENGTNENSGATVTNLPVGNHTVSFTPIYGWATPSNLTVTITKGETTKTNGVYVEGNPELIITSPKSGQRWSNTDLTITGTTTDKVTVTNVYYQLNNGGWTPASPSNSFWSNWTAIVALTNGSNTLSAYAQDNGSAVSPTNTVKFLYIPSATLTLHTNGNGKVTPDDTNAWLAIGTNYTLTATQGINWIFSNWVACGSESFVSNNPVLKFQMKSNLTLTANFVTNVFLAAQGGYNGLFAPTNSPRGQSNSGSFNLNVTSLAGVSGDLYLGSEIVPLTGKFDVGGWVQILQTGHIANPLITTLQLNFSDKSVQGMVSNANFTAILNGDQSVFTAIHKATNFEGQYTLTIPGTTNSAVGPFGNSYGTVTVSDLGAITFAGSLADGTTITPSSVVSKDGYWPFYVNLYGGKGSLWGWNFFTNHTLSASPSLSWINATNSSFGDVYRQGFTNDQTTVIGHFYVSTNKPLLSVTNLQVILECGNPPISITNQITLSSNGVIAVPHSAENTNGLTLTIINKSTGLMTGSFKNPVNPRQTINVNGVLLQNQTNAAGYFLGTNQSGAFLLESQ